MKLNRFWIGAGVLSASAILLAKRYLPATCISFNTVDPEQALDDGSQFVDVQSLRVRTRVEGEGRPAIVLLHGFAASVFTWHKVFHDLSELGMVIAFDRPAYGFTSRPIEAEWDGHSPYSLESQVDLTIGMFDQFGIDRAILIGHSAGGTVAALTALRHPDRIQSLVLMSPAVYTDVPPPHWLRWLVNVSFMRKVGPWIARTAARFADLIMNRAWHDSSRITPEIREGYLRSFRTMNWDKGMWEATRAHRSSGLRHEIRSLQIPTLVITGDDDRIVPVAETKRVANELPDATLIVIPDCGHIPQEEQPQALLDALTPFIKTISSSRP